MATDVYIEPPGSLTGRAKRIRYYMDGDCMVCISHPRIGSDLPSIKRGGQQKTVARYVYELERGPVPDGMFLTRTCTEQMCISPGHMAVKPFPDGRKVKGKRRERIARVSAITGVRAAAAGFGVSPRTVIRIRDEYGFSSHQKRNPGTGRYTI